MQDFKSKLHTLNGNAAYLKTQIKRAYYKDYFFDAEKFEYELEMVQDEIETLKKENK